MQDLEAHGSNATLKRVIRAHLALDQNQWYHFGVGAPPIVVYFRGDWNVHWGCGILTHGHLWSMCQNVRFWSAAGFQLGFPGVSVKPAVRR